MNISSGTRITIKELSETIREVDGLPRAKSHGTPPSPTGRWIKYFRSKRLHELGLNCPTPLKDRAAEDRRLVLTGTQGRNGPTLMIISRTPFRVSFFGGGTDFPEFYPQHGGAVLTTTIDKFCYITIHRLAPFFKYRFKANYARTETVMSPSEIQHPLIRESLLMTGITDGVEIAHVSDLPGRTGLGTSSSFTVGLLHALHVFLKQKCHARTTGQRSHHHRTRAGAAIRAGTRTSMRRRSADSCGSIFPGPTTSQSRNWSFQPTARLNCRAT